MTELFSIVESHHSNHCSANCVICSKHHGGNGQHFSTPEVVNATIAQLQRLNWKGQIQLGGDGDSFLNPNFPDFAQAYKHGLPDSKTCLYTSAFSMTPNHSDWILSSGAIDEIQVRIDTLNPILYRQSTGLFLRKTLANLDYFIGHNRGVKLCLFYFPLYAYRGMCQKILGKPPAYFAGRIDESLLRDEWPEFQAWVESLDIHHTGLISTRLSGICLWAERVNCEFTPGPCNQLPENETGAWKRQIYICPDGRIMPCAYTDRQDEFILGNVLTDKLEDMWFGEKKKQFAEAVRNRTAENCPRHCLNPAACRTYDVA